MVDCCVWHWLIEACEFRLIKGSLDRYWMIAPEDCLGIPTKEDFLGFYSCSPSGVLPSFFWISPIGETL